LAFFTTDAPPFPGFGILSSPSKAYKNQSLPIFIPCLGENINIFMRRSFSKLCPFCKLKDRQGPLQ
jgi:hypothetical protein